MEAEIPTRPKREEEIDISKLLKYITDDMARESAGRFLKEVQSWNPKAIDIRPRSGWAAVNASGDVVKKIMEWWPARKHWVVNVLDLEEGKWQTLRVHTEEDYNQVISLVKTNLGKAGVKFVEPNHS